MFGKIPVKCPVLIVLLKYIPHYYIVRYIIVYYITTKTAHIIKNYLIKYSYAMLKMSMSKNGHKNWKFGSTDLSLVSFEWVSMGTFLSKRY